ncbi:hypothetical protein [Xanthomonas sp. XNM01]|uniref:hypothetical protein n=1 Tax=Xanthomonas sp. XNM01 TaxID=2769289 RepID=UPI00177EDF5C|nr:hypothetical protein [Xanthomonas sp. XNM01]MBD9368221.1 hypothetical protein [Xanthomonas sp. XNM01]
MSFKRLFASLLPSPKSNDGAGFVASVFGGSKPRGHFREFTVPRRYQRGGAARSGSGSRPVGCADGIIPCTGGNIP